MGLESFSREGDRRSIEKERLAQVCGRPYLNHVFVSNPRIPTLHKPDVEVREENGGFVTAINRETKKHVLNWS